MIIKSELVAEVFVETLGRGGILEPLGDLHDAVSNGAHLDGAFLRR